MVELTVTRCELVSMNNNKAVNSLIISLCLLD